MKLKVLVAAMASVMVFAISADPASAACKGKGPFGGYKVVVPSDDVPEEMARFSGVWDGTWLWNNRTLCHTVAVEKISPSGDVVLVYSVAAYDQYYGWHTRVKGSIGMYGNLTFTVTNPVQQKHSFVYYYKGDELTGIANRKHSGSVRRREG